jgi:hypothetical protein
LNKAADHLDEKKVMISMATALLARMRKHDFSIRPPVEHFIAVLEARSDLRLKLVETMVPCFDDIREDAAHISRFGLRLIVTNHFDWVRNRLLSATEPKIKRAYAQLLNYIFYPDDVSRISAIIETAAQYPVLYELMSEVLCGCSWGARCRYAAGG